MDASDRLLVCSAFDNAELTDLLYFDALLTPPFKSHPRPIVTGLTHQETDVLIENDLIKSWKYLFSDSFLFEELFRNTWLGLGAISKKYPEIEDLVEFDRISNRLISIILSNETKFNTIPRYDDSENFSRDFKPGKHPVLNIVFSCLPTILPSDTDINHLIDFLNDEETQLKKRRLFSWQNEIETKIEKGEIKIEHLPDLIATRIEDYIEHMKISQLKFKYGVLETILWIGANLISGLTLVGLPKAIKNLLDFKKKEIELKEAEMTAPGKELAYIVHAARVLQDS